MAEWRKTMGVTYVKEVISPEELFERYPLPEAHKKLKGTFSKDKNEILFKDFGINYNNEPEVYKKGTVLAGVKSNELNEKFKTDELLYQNDQFSKELIFNEQSSVLVCHNDLIKDEFWNKEIVDFD